MKTGEEGGRGKKPQHVFMDVNQQFGLKEPADATSLISPSHLACTPPPPPVHGSKINSDLCGVCSRGGCAATTIVCVRRSARAARVCSFGH